MRRLAALFFFLFTIAGGRAQTAPSIVPSQVGVNINDEGADVTLTWNLTGTPPFTCHWRRDGVLFSTTTATDTRATLVLPAVKLADSSTWQIEVSNSAGAAVSDPRSMIVRPATAPSIRDHPVGSSGGNLFVNASGSAPLSYQWFRDGVAIPGATTNSGLVFASPPGGQIISGDYACEVSNRAGRVVSNVAQVRSNPDMAPVIRTEPASRNIYPEPDISEISLSVGSRGSPFPTYQWRKNGVAISNATSSSLSLRKTDAGTPGDYTVLVTNPQGSVTSETARVAPAPAQPPAIVRHPSSLVLRPGMQPSFSVTLETRNIGEVFQWRREGVPLAGKTNGSLPAENLSAGNYDVVVSNASGAATSRPARLTFASSGSTPLIETSPASAGVRAGFGATLTVRLRPDVSPTDIVRVDWRRDGVLLPNTVTQPVSSLSLYTSVLGIYTVTVATRSGETETSESAHVSDLDAGRPPFLLTQPAGGTRLAGAKVELKTTALGEFPLTYRWSRDGVPVSGATAEILTLTPCTPADAGTYVATISNRLGTITTEPARLAVVVPPPPSFSRQPAAIGRALGETAILFATAATDDNGTYTYQWYRDGTLVVGATDQLLTLANLNPAQIGRYTVVATDYANRTVTSEPADVGLIGRQTLGPRFTLSPSDRSLRTGDCTTLVCDAESGSGRSYQWFKGGTAIPGATRQTLFLAYVTPADAGNYRVDIADRDATISSRDAVVTVSAGEPRPLAPVILAIPASARVIEGDPLVLAVDVVGDPPPTFQWLKNGVPLSGATNRTFTLPVASVADAGTYFADISTAAGTLRLPSAVVTITARLSPPALAFSSATRWDVPVGSGVVLQTTVTGSPPLNVSWRKDDGLPVSGHTSVVTASGVSTFAVGRPVNQGIEFADAGTYYAVVTNSAGTARTPSVQVAVHAADSTGLYLSSARSQAAAVLVQPDRTAVAIVAGSPVTASFFHTKGSVDLTGQLVVDGSVAPGSAGARILRGLVRGENLRLTADLSSLDLTLQRVSVQGPFADFSGAWIAPLPADIGGMLQLVIGPSGEALVCATTANAQDAKRAYFVTERAVSVGFLGLLTANLTLSSASGPPALVIDFGGPGRSPTRVLATRPAAPLTNRFANIATRGRAGAGVDTMTAGFVLAGSAPGTVLIRAIGPTLATFGVADPLGDPLLEFFSSTTRVATNDNWDGASELANAAARVGAFPLSATSADSALVATLAPSAYTAQATALAGTSAGESLVEIYDLATSNGSRLVNLSTRGRVAGNSGLLNAGIVVAGNSPKRILIRAIGPALAAFGVADFLVDPRLRIVRSDATLAENDDWAAQPDVAAEISAASVAIGAFALPVTGKDAALLLTLAPGNYTAVVSGVTALAGAALVEVYEVP